MLERRFFEWRCENAGVPVACRDLALELRRSGTAKAEVFQSVAPFVGAVGLASALGPLLVSFYAPIFRLLGAIK